MSVHEARARGIQNHNIKYYYSNDAIGTASSRYIIGTLYIIKTQCSIL